ncbi:hypothetical protein LC061_21005, partial [Nitratireductor aquimarinus]|nr:hypothetical protein [Nitratireductor aquimarinus]
MTGTRDDLYREAKRTALILASAQAIVGSAAPIAISMGGLAGFYLLGSDKSLATAPVTGFNVGIEETEEEARYRRAACLLADIGWRAHPEYRGTQSLNIIA